MLPVFNKNSECNDIPIGAQLLCAVENYGYPPPPPGRRMYASIGRLEARLLRRSLNVDSIDLRIDTTSFTLNTELKRNTLYTVGTATGLSRFEALLNVVA